MRLLSPRPGSISLVHSFSHFISFFFFFCWCDMIFFFCIGFTIISALLRIVNVACTLYGLYNNLHFHHAQFSSHFMHLLHLGTDELHRGCTNSFTSNCNSKSVKSCHLVVNIMWATCKNERTSKNRMVSNGGLLLVAFRGRRCAYIAFYDANTSAKRKKPACLHLDRQRVKTLGKGDGVRENGQRIWLMSVIIPLHTEIYLTLDLFFCFYHLSL